ncbi:RNA-binding S4 domain-containing protein [Flavobacteriaceae bacterium]|nr:RNA-binding S4 domain-containing protein [Flavobacteriaceae bacterium]
MRIDKYLWCTRYFKTRNMAAEAIKKGSVRINGHIAKPAKEVFSGDEITLRIHQITRTLSVLELPTSRVSAKIVGMHCLDKTPAHVLAQHKEIKRTQSYYRDKGLGRPTKKDRRDLEDYTDSEQD